MSENLILVAIYLRVSSELQKVSIERQMQEIMNYCRNMGFKVVKIYKDEFISGSRDEKKRVAFYEMLADSSKGEWTRLICWDLARYGRQDILDSAPSHCILRDNKVMLETIKEGQFDLSPGSGDVWKLVALAQAAHLFSVNLGKDILSGRRRALEAGLWPNGGVVYGYDKEYSNGTEKKVVRRGESWNKGRDWHLRPIVNEEEAKIVRWLYEQFVHFHRSHRSMAKELNDKGVPSPCGAHWTQPTIARILRSKDYIGIGGLGLSDYKPTKKRFNKSEALERKGLCPVIVDEKLWNEAQGKKRKRFGGSDGERSSALSGSLMCGHCRYALSKDIHKYRRCVGCHTECKTNSHRCSGCKELFSVVGKESMSGNVFACVSSSKTRAACHHWSVREEEILPLVCERLVKRLDDELIGMLATKAEAVVDETSLLEKRVVGLKADLARLWKKYEKEEDDDMILGVRALIKEKKAELEKAEENLSVAQVKANKTAVEKFVASEWPADKKVLQLVAEGKMVLVRPVSLEPLLPQTEGRVVGKVLHGLFGEPAPGQYDTVVERPAIIATADQVRAILHKLGVKVFVKWTQLHGGKRPGFKWDSAQIKVEFGFGLNGFAPHDIDSTAQKTNECFTVRFTC